MVAETWDIALIAKAGLQNQLRLAASLTEPIRCDVYRFEGSSL